ncbi:MAG: aminotransferase class I/II-fold pyridoxal phosphate-dependent enzyme [Flavobacteriaceae bacterium]
MIVNNFPDRLINHKGKIYLYFGGTSYLGMAALPEFQNQLTESIKQWGSFYGSSRNSNIKLGVYDAFENEFTICMGTESTIAVSSGTLAGKSVLEYFTKHSTPCFHYPNSHPAIVAPNSKPIFLNGTIHPDLTTPLKEEIVIVLDAILPMEVTPTTLNFLNLIPPNKKVNLVIDESHSLGITGPIGFGIFNTISHNNIYRKIMVSSLSKALALSGGIIASDSAFIDSLKAEDNYVSASPANPAYLDAFLKSKVLYAKQQQKLKNNLNYFFSGETINPKFKFSPNYPVIFCEEEGTYKKLHEQGVIITNFKYPNYKGMMNRIVITANHTQNDLTKLKNALIEL